MEEIHQINIDDVLYLYTLYEDNTITIKGISSIKDNIIIPEKITIENIDCIVKEIDISWLDANLDELLIKKTYDEFVIPQTIERVFIYAEQGTPKSLTVNGGISLFFIEIYNQVLESLFLRGECRNDFEISIYKCKRLKHIEFGQSYNACEKTLECCESLSEIVITDGFEFDNSTFRGCSSLSYIAEEFCIREGLLYDRDLTILYTCLDLKKERFEIPKSIIKIGAGCFMESDCKMVDLSKTSLDEIPNDTFYNCKMLENIIFPKSLRIIGERAFNGCEHLRAVNIDNINELKCAVFAKSGLESIVLPNSLSKIPKSAFLDCTKLQSVQLPLQLESYIKNAFKGCSKIRRVIMPQYLEKHTNDMFPDANVEVVILGNSMEHMNSKISYERIHTQGRLRCPYCGSNNIKTYVDGTADCYICGREFTYWSI